MDNTDVVYNCVQNSDTSVSFTSISGRERTVLIPEDEQPFGSWLVDYVLRVASIKAGQRLVLTNGTDVVGEYLCETLISRPLSIKYRRELATRPPSSMASGLPLTHLEIDDRKRKLIVYDSLKRSKRS